MLVERSAARQIEEDLRATARRLLEHAQRVLPGEVEVVGLHHTQLQLGLEKNDYELASSTELHGFGIRAIHEGRLGWASSNTVDSDASIQELLRQVAAVAGASPADPDLSLPSGDGTPHSVTTVDGAFHEATEEEARDLFVGWVEAMRTQDERLSLRQAGLGVGLTGTCVLNSRGVDTCHVDGGASAYLVASGQSGAEVTSFDYEGIHTRRWAEVPDRVTFLADQLLGRVLRCFGSRRGHTYQGRVLLDPQAVRDLVISPLCFQANGLNVARGQTRCKAPGDQLGSPLLDLLHVPLDPGGSSARPFDREGVPTTELPIVQAGRLRNFCVDTRAAAALGRTLGDPTLISNGFATGDYRSTPVVGTHNLQLRSGTASIAELEEALGNGILVQRFSGNVDPISGRFSGVAKGAQVFQDGKRQHAATELMISGNLFEVLEQVVAVGQPETAVWLGSVQAPPVLLDGVSVVSA